MPETYTNFNPSGVPDGHGTGVASIIGPGVTQVGGDIYIANSDGTFGNQISGSGGGQLPTYSTASAITITETGAGGLELHDTGAGGITLLDAGAGGVTIHATHADGEILLEVPATGSVVINGNSGGAITIGATTTDLVGFFGTTPVVQQDAVTTLDEVIAVLVAFGLVAS